MFSKLIFKSPPETWEHFLPLGNGRLGAMVKTHPCNETLQLNEEGIWSGGPMNRINESSQIYMKKVRLLLQEGRFFEAQELAFRYFSGKGFNERVYQTAGDFHIDFFSQENYGIHSNFPPNHVTSKECLDSFLSYLDLETASVNVQYTDENGIKFYRRTWISATDDMLFMYVKSSEDKKINFRSYFDRGIWYDSFFSKKNMLYMEDSHGIPFCMGCATVCRDGDIKAEGFTLCGSECSEILFFIDISVLKYSKNLDLKKYKKKALSEGYKHILERKLLKMRDFINENGVSKSYEILFERHLKEYESYYKRFYLHLGRQDENEKKNVNEGKCILFNSDFYKSCYTVSDLFSALENDDFSIVNLYVAFSRYLMIAGSRKPGKLPLTLQGLWNSYIEPPWGSKYTLNINTQMNYWPSCMTNLCECELPLFALLKRAYKNGCLTAKKMYGCRGYVIHHNTDFWGDCAPQDNWIPGSYWVLGAAWLATHIWSHFEYSQDFEFLRVHYYLLHEACLFFVDFLQPASEKIGTALDGKPYLVVNPSLSPENSYITKKGEIGALCEGCQMDNMILYHLFSSCLKAKNVLKNLACNKKGKVYSSKDFLDFKFVLSHLKNPEIRSDGTLMEWNTDFEEVEKGHRHISHLYGLFPGISISMEDTPKLSEAARKTLEKRLYFGGGHTGWSQAWIINFWASLFDGEKAGEAVKKILKNSTLGNLLDNHPPFQIDGNFGALTGIVRMIVQSKISENGKIIVSLLPALPSNKFWQEGEMRGVLIKGGYSLNLKWRNGQIYKLKIFDAQDKEISEDDCKEFLEFKRLK